MRQKKPEYRPENRAINPGLPEFRKSQSAANNFRKNTRKTTGFQPDKSVLYQRRHRVSRENSKNCENENGKTEAPGTS